MAQYQLQIAELRRQLAELSTTFTADHYKTQKVQASIKELEAARDRERKNIISRIRVDYEAAERREAQLQKAFQQQAESLSGQAEHLIQYNLLAREVETNKKLYDQTMAQGKEAGLASAMRQSNARVVDPAVVPGAPRSPNLPLNFSIGMAGGLFFGVLFVIVRCTLEARVQSPGVFHVNLRELGVIPSASVVRGLRNRSRLLHAVGDKVRATRNKENTSSILTQPENVKQVPESLELVTATQKTSVMSEAFRSAMTSILFSAETGERSKAFVITSPAPREGKTTVSTNLAIALSEINHRVVLIDADMRRPRLHKVFDLPNTLGLSDFLHERKPLDQYLDEELVRPTHIPNLFVMPAGPARPNLLQLFYSARMKDLLERLRSTFDTLLLDTAPMMSVPDARILARAADAVILVIRAHQTYQESALAAIRCFEEDGCLVLGTILNDWNPRRSTYGPYGTNTSAYRIYGH
jgi:capsular exopolysaccharide synthesis family protein